MAHSNAYLSDPYPSSRQRLAALINLSDGTGAATSGVVPAIAADPADFFANGDTSPTEADYSMDNLITAGIRRVVLNRPWGDWNAAGELANCPGHYPFTYPTSDAGNFLGVAPRTQTQSQTAFGGLTWTNALKAAFDTPGRLGSLYGAAIYSAPLPASSDFDSTTLINNSEFVNYMGMEQICDVQSVISRTATAPPALMGANCLGWWEADKRSYTDSGSTQATNGQGVYHWDSLVGSSSWANSTTSQQPVFTASAVNGYPAMQFDSATFRRWTNASPISPGAAFTICMVVKPTASDEIMMSAAAGATNRQIRFNESAGGRISMFDGTNVTVAASSSFTANTWTVIRFRHTGTICRIFVNGTETSYFGANNAESNMVLSMLGAFGNGGASNFFTGQLAALAIMDANCTDNQVQLIEKYWATKYALTVAGSPTLPHSAWVDYLHTNYSINTYREDFNYRTITELSDWDTNSGGIITVYASLAAAILNAANVYTIDSIGVGQRARVMIPASGLYISVASRIAAVPIAAALGYDIDLDFGGFTTEQITTTISTFNTIADGPSGTPSGIIGHWPELARIWGQSQRWPIPPR